MGKAQVRKYDRHTGSTDLQGSNDIMVNGLGVHRKDDRDSGGVQREASTSVFANGKGRARVGDKNNWGRPEVTGSPNVFIL